jgi:hypothetical protein
MKTKLFIGEPAAKSFTMQTHFPDYITTSDKISAALPRHPLFPFRPLDGRPGGHPRYPQEP